MDCRVVDWSRKAMLGSGSEISVKLATTTVAIGCMANLMGIRGRCTGCRSQIYGGGNLDSVAVS